LLGFLGAASAAGIHAQAIRGEAKREAATGLSSAEPPVLDVKPRRTRKAPVREDR
jgi:hypothetical protein